jgi:transcription-repair coupling factor (superfamily II helicase)
MQEVGFALYTDMLQLAVKALKAGKEPDLASTLARIPEINLHAPALLPATYCEDVHERLMLYKRLANCNSSDEVSLLREELVDRFGRLPEPATTLVEVHRLRLLAQAIGLSKVDATPDAITLQFNAQPITSPAVILKFAQSRRDTSFAGQDRLRVKVTTADVASRSRLVREILTTLQPGVGQMSIASSPSAAEHMAPVLRPPVHGFSS